MSTRSTWKAAAIPAPNNDSWVGETYPVAALICAVGFFMRIILSGPVLNILGINYGAEDASLLAKIHPGSYFIILSFMVLICSQGNPFAHLIRIARQHTAYFSFVVIYVLILLYWILRGPKGIGVILDIHIAMPMCAIVFCYAPRSYCKAIVYGFAALAIANSLVGIFESMTHLRLFPFDAEWEVLKQDYFRSSALLGHPLTNASFTAVAMFVLLSLRMPAVLKSGIFLIMLSSLVAFGSRAALGGSLIGLVLLGIAGLRNYFAFNRLTVLQMMLVLLSALLVPLFCVGLLYGILHSGIGERLMAYSSLSDDSAGVRMLVFRVFDHMYPTELIFGVDGDRITDIAYHTGVESATSDIENPWVLMFMFLGAIMFTLWFCGWSAFVMRLMAGASPALKLAVIEYFIIATTSNSFGRKDPVYLILAGIVVCAKRLKQLEDHRQRETYL
jgi:hypothetical protein